MPAPKRRRRFPHMLVAFYKSIFQFAENSQRLRRASGKAVVSPCRIVGSFAASMWLPLMIDVTTNVPVVVWLALCRQTPGHSAKHLDTPPIIGRT
jgi:hypothetical protein